MVFLSIFIITDSILFYKGYNTYLWRYKTDLEKQVQLTKFGLEKIIIKSGVTEKDIDVIAKNIATKFTKVTGVVSEDGTYYQDLIAVIKEELKSPNIPKN